MRASRFFRIVSRVNALLLLAAGVTVLVMLGAFGISELGSRTQAAPQPMAVVPERGEALFLGGVEEVDGTPYVVLPLLAGERSEVGYGSPSSSERERRNLLFHDVDKGASRWLLPTHTTRIREYVLVHEDGAETLEGSGGVHRRPVRWIRYELGPPARSHAQDQIAVAVSGPTGEELTRVLEGVDEILGYGPLRGTRQAVFFRRGAEHLTGELDYATRKPVQGRPLPKP
jgi:hypothetical protein